MEENNKQANIIFNLTSRVSVFLISICNASGPKGDFFHDRYEIWRYFCS